MQRTIHIAVRTEGEIKNPVPLELRINGDVIAALAEEMGLEIKRTKDPNNPFVQLNGIRDPNIVYLFEPEDGEALIFWKDRTQGICWEDATKASIRKILNDDGTDSECTVCFDDLPLREAINCTRCCSKICSTCLMRLCLTEQGIQQISRRDFKASHKCPECRNLADYDFREYYHRVLDRLHEFSNDQRRAMMFAKDHDPLFHLRMRAWIDKHPLLHFKPGLVIKLKGLKSKRKWNGKMAKITGEPQIKGDILRWPVKLIGKRSRNEKALLKQGNMCTPRNVAFPY